MNPGSEGLPGALEGLKVLEIAQVIAIPVCGLLLADMGANVIKVEPPEGDALRSNQQPIVPGEGKSFTLLNRGKRSVCLDITKPEARPAIEGLLKWADVVLVSMKPADLPRYRLSYADVCQLNPEVVFLEHVPLGMRGPMGGDGGYDVVVQGMSGIGAVTARPNGDAPATIRPAYADFGTGFLSAFGVVAALNHRMATGRGQRVETSLLATSLTQAAPVVNWFGVTDPDVEASWREQRSAAAAAGAGFEEQRALWEKAYQGGGFANIYFRHYRTRDGFLSVGCLSAATNARFRAVTRVVDPRLEPGFELGTPEAYDRLTVLLRSTEDLFRQRTTEEWIGLLRAGGVPCGPFNFPPDVFHDPQVLANDYVIELEHDLLGPYKTFAPPIRMDLTPTRVRRSSPVLGSHTEEVLAEVGLPPNEIAALVAAGVAGPNPR
ncbi:MAG: CoA transferase [Dehalococcoidia bacterium]|nr:CoA transferase [Dehalococcoidia bacterium]